MEAELASNPPTPPGDIVLDAHLAYSLCAYVDGPQSGPPPSGWVEVWVPTKPKHLEGNYAIVLQATAQPTLLALAIQGTQDLKDVLEDFHVVPQYPFPPIEGAAIAHGSHHGLQDLLGLAGTYEGAPKTLGSLLSSIPAGTSLLVTGHSLGGNLASVMAPWIAANVAAFGPNQSPLSSLPKHLTTITFAAPTAGNAAFAQFLDANPERYRAHFNRNDVVSNVWAESGPLRIPNIDGLFPPPGPSPAPAFVQKLLKDKVDQMAKADPPVSYTQTKGFIFEVTPAPPPNPAPVEAWLWELGYEHNDAYSQQFLGPTALRKP